MAKNDTNRNLVAAISYLLGFITGIVIFLVEKEDKYIRFHALQSTLIFGGFFVLNIILDVFFRGVLGVFASGISMLVSLAALVVWIVSMIKAYQGEVFKWPIVGDYVERKLK